MPKTHRQILEEAMQAREGILKRERERMEQEEAKEYNLEDMMEEKGKKSMIHHIMVQLKRRV